MHCFKTFVDFDDVKFAFINTPIGGERVTWECVKIALEALDNVGNYSQ